MVLDGNLAGLDGELKSMNLTLKPMYADYRTAKAVRAAWDANKDFRICNVFHPDDGRPINKRDAKPGMVLNIRFAGLTKICRITVVTGDLT